MAYKQRWISKLSKLTTINLYLTKKEQKLLWKFVLILKFFKVHRQPKEESVNFGIEERVFFTLVICGLFTILKTKQSFHASIIQRNSTQKVTFRSCSICKLAVENWKLHWICQQIFAPRESQNYWKFIQRRSWKSQRCNGTKFNHFSDQTTITFHLCCRWNYLIISFDNFTNSYLLF